MTLTTKINRVRFLQNDDPSLAARRQLAADARELLKYNHLATAIAAPGALIFALRKLEIAPLIHREVLAYKTRKSRPGMWSGQKKGLGLAATAITCCFMATLLNRRMSWNQFSPLQVAILVMTVLAVIFAVVAVCLLLDKEFRGERTIRSWNTCPLSQFDGAVPEFVLHKAVQIKKAAPATVFTVEYLVETNETATRRDPDPFLVAHLGDEHIYIDVWDEKEYEATI